MEKRTIYRSAITGRLISKEHAEAHPDTTTKETVDPPWEITSTRVKESLSYLIWMLETSASYTEEDEHDLEQLKLLV